MYRIRVTKGIWTADRGTVEAWLSAGNRVASRARGAGTPSLAIFSREMELPFPPYLGLRIATEQWECEPLDRIEWAAAESLFKCSVADEYPNRSGQREIDHDALVQRALGNGWLPTKPTR